MYIKPKDKHRLMPFEQIYNNDLNKHFACLFHFGTKKGERRGGGTYLIFVNTPESVTKKFNKGKHNNVDS